MSWGHIAWGRASQHAEVPSLAQAYLFLDMQDMQDMQDMVCAVECSQKVNRPPFPGR